MEDPKPVPYLALDRGAQFRVVIASRPQHKDAAEKAKNQLIEALENEGFGAHASRGMGYFKEMESK